MGQMSNRYPSVEEIDVFKLNGDDDEIGHHYS